MSEATQTEHTELSISQFPEIKGWVEDRNAQAATKLMADDSIRPGLTKIRKTLGQLDEANQNTIISVLAGAGEQTPARSLIRDHLLRDPDVNETGRAIAEAIGYMSEEDGLRTVKQLIGPVNSPKITSEPSVNEAQVGESSVARTKSPSFRN